MSDATSLHQRPRLLCVDDDPQLLTACRALLSRRFAVTVTTDPCEALRQVEAGPPFEVLVSDMRMPAMDGLELLRRVRAVAPDTATVLLTGAADLGACVRAVNEAHVFRLLEKPCDPDDLLVACDAAAGQHRLVVAQRELLEETLRGAVQTLADVLALAMPTAFGRAERLAESVREMARAEDRSDAWAAEMGALLSQLGCASLPPETLEKLNAGAVLDPREEVMVARMPKAVLRLLKPIPRLEPVLDVIRLQSRRYDGKDAETRARRKKDIPWGARALRIALDYDVLSCQGLRPDLALSTMKGREGVYDPDLLLVFAKLQGARNDHVVVREIPLRAVRPDMTFVQDVRLPNGVVLVTHGQMVTAGILERIRNLDRTVQETQVRVSIAVRGLAETVELPTLAHPRDEVDPIAIPAVRLAPSAASVPRPSPSPKDPSADARRLRISQVDLDALSSDLDELDPLV